jgi:ABC-2 type transport system permease protein
MMMSALRFEFDKLVRRPAFWWATVAAAVMAIIFGYVIPYLVGPASGGDEPGSTQGEPGYSVPLELLLPERMVENAISGFPLFYLALALVLGALFAGSEYEWGTVRSIALWGPGRIQMLLAKAVVLVAMLVVVAVSAFLASAASAWVVAAIEGESTSPPPLDELVRGIGAAWLILAVGAMLGLGGATLARSSGAVIGVGLVYLFVIELLLRTFVSRSAAIEATAKVLPGTNAGSLAGAFAETSEGAPGVTDLVGAGQAVGLLAGWLAVSVIVAMALFARRDIDA